MVHERSADNLLRTCLQSHHTVRHADGKVAKRFREAAGDALQLTLWDARVLGKSRCATKARRMRQWFKVTLTELGNRRDTTAVNERANGCTVGKSS